MLRLALVGLAVAVIGLIALLLFEIRGDSEEEAEPPAEAIEDPPSGEAPARPAVPKPIRLRGEVGETEGAGQGDEPAPQEAEPLRELDPHAKQIFLAQDVRQKILLAASPCYRGEGEESAKMKVRYTVRFQDGHGTFERVSLVESEIEDRDLEQCVLTAIRELEMKEPVQDLAEDETMEISILGLKKRARGMGVPLDPEER